MEVSKISSESVRAEVFLGIFGGIEGGLEKAESCSYSRLAARHFQGPERGAFRGPGDFPF